MNLTIYRIYFYKNGKLTNALIDPKNLEDFEKKLNAFLKRRSLPRTAIVRVEKYELDGAIYVN